MSSLSFSIDGERPVFAMALLRGQHERIVSLVHGCALLLLTKTTNMRYVAVACKWLSSATCVAASVAPASDFMPFYAQCIATGACSWLHVLCLCDPASFKFSLASMYKSAAAASKCSPPTPFTDMFHCNAHFLMAKACKDSYVDALALCYKPVARAPAQPASRSICCAAVCLLPPSNASALSGRRLYDDHRVG